MNKWVLLLIPVLLSSALLAGEGPSGGQVNALPPALQGIGITEHLNAQLPLDLEFTDSTGRKVQLREYFNGKKPVLLALAYYRCPMLCNLVLQGMAESLNKLPWTAGKEYECVVLSFDPLEEPKLAAGARDTFIERYERPEGGPGIHFLTGAKAPIAALAEAVGFGYRWVPEEQQYAHAAAIYALTPDGKVSRYLYGIQYSPRDLRLSLVEAAEGKSGSFGDQILMFCFHYDDAAHTYTLAARSVMQLGGVLTLVFLAMFLGVYWRRDVKRQTQKAAASTLEGHP